ncbi:MAG: 4Fe-4S binding protein [Chloroflexi bacterium]|nr:4Fe-4S binding protein [Chloroflexota bacterium]
MVFEGKEMFGLIYAVIALIVIVLLSRKGRFSKKIGYFFLTTSAAMGFLVWAPMLPWQFQSLLLGNSKQFPQPVMALVLLMFVVATFVFGRVFCGYICPIGTLQELLYKLPVKKLRISSRRIPIIIHFGVLIAFVVLATVFSIGLLKEIGLRDFYFLSLTASFGLVFTAFMVASIFVYRPFCRFACPYGAVLSLVATKSRFKMRQNDDCINCKKPKCVAACPTNEALDMHSKQECYLCYQCATACPTKAIEYKRT